MGHAELVFHHTNPWTITDDGEPAIRAPRVHGEDKVTNGPDQTLSTTLYRCDAARQTGLSLQPQDPVMVKLVVCGTVRQFAALARTAAMG